MQQDEPFELHGRRVLITGASSGIGVALAIEAARRGARLLLTGRDGDRLVQTAEQCLAAGADDPELFVFDLVDVDARRALAAACRPIDVLVHNAGLLLGGPFENGSEERLLALLRLNLEVPLHLTQLFANELEQRAGALVLVSSGVARQPLPYNVAYNTSKVGLTNFGRALALEWEHRGRAARVLVAHPGATATPMLEGVDADKRSPESVAGGIWDALAAGEALWWASGRDEELIASYAREDERARERAAGLETFFGSAR